MAGLLDPEPAKGPSNSYTVDDSSGITAGPSSQGEQKFKSFMFQEVKVRAVAKVGGQRHCTLRLVAVFMLLMAPLFVASFATTIVTNEIALRNLIANFGQIKESFSRTMEKSNLDFTVLLSSSNTQIERTFAIQTGNMAKAISNLASISAQALSESIQTSLIEQDSVLNSIKILAENSSATTDLVARSTRETVNQLLPQFHGTIADGVFAAMLKVLRVAVDAGTGYEALHRRVPKTLFNSLDEVVWQENLLTIWLDIQKIPFLVFAGIMGPNHGPDVNSSSPWTEIGCSRSGTFFAISYRQEESFEFYPTTDMKVKRLSDLAGQPYYIDSREYSDNCPSGIPGYHNGLTVYSDLCSAVVEVGFNPSDPYVFGHGTLLYQHPLFMEEMPTPGKPPFVLQRDAAGRLVNASSGTVESCRSFEISTSFVSELLRDYISEARGTFAIILNGIEIIAGSGLGPKDLFVLTSYEKGLKNATEETFADIIKFCRGLDGYDENIERTLYGEAVTVTATLEGHHNPNVTLMGRILLPNMTRLEEDSVSWITQLEEEYLTTCRRLQFKGLKWNLCVYSELNRYSDAYRESLALGARLQHSTGSILNAFSNYASTTTERLRSQLETLEANSKNLTTAIDLVQANITRSINETNAAILKNADRHILEGSTTIADFGRNTDDLQKRAKDDSLKGIWVTVGMFALMMIGCAVVITSFVRPLFRLQGLMRSVANMEVENVEAPKSYIHELSDMYKSFITMVQCMQVYKSYLPQGLFEEATPLVDNSPSSDEWQPSGALRPKLTNGVIVVVKMRATISNGLTGSELTSIHEELSRKVDEIAQATLAGKIICICGDRVVVYLPSVANLPELLESLMAINSGVHIACARSPVLLATLGSASFRAVNAIGPAVTLAHSMIKICEAANVKCVISHSIHQYLQYSCVLVPFGQLVTSNSAPSLVYEVLRATNSEGDKEKDKEWMYNVSDVGEINTQFGSIMDQIVNGNFDLAESELANIAPTSPSISLLRDSCLSRSILKFHSHNSSKKELLEVKLQEIEL